MINGLLQKMLADNVARRIGLNPRAQFGTKRRRYIGAELLPERRVKDNMYTEQGIKYRTVIANAGTRYSPSQKKGGALVGSMEVKLAESDIASELTAQDYDALLDLLNRNQSMDAMASIVRFLDSTVNLPLVELLEKWRWEAIVDAKVKLRGDSGYSEDVSYSDPTGHRLDVLSDWNDPTVDPFDDIFSMVEMLAGKGFEVGRITSSRRVVGILGRNEKVRTRTSKITVSNGNITATPGRATIAEINGALQADGLPPIEMYDLQYRTSTGTGRFLPNDVMVFTCFTGRDEQLDLGDGNHELLPDTLGYTGIGRPAGQSGAGRVLRMEHFTNKPPRIEAEGWQTGLPVIIEPESIGVLKGIGRDMEEPEEPEA